MLLAPESNIPTFIISEYASLRLGWLVAQTSAWETCRSIFLALPVGKGPSRESEREIYRRIFTTCKLRFKSDTQFFKYTVLLLDNNVSNTEMVTGLLLVQYQLTLRGSAPGVVVEDTEGTLCEYRWSCAAEKINQSLVAHRGERVDRLGKSNVKR